MKKAITKAIEGGYKNELDMSPDFLLETNKRIIVTDPMFWRALGNSEGWNDDEGTYFNHKWLTKEGDEFLEPYRIVRGQNSWQYHMHLFIDHIIAGKDINSFFNNLIK